MSHEKHSEERPSCFGNLETVFPMEENGLRGSPDRCMACVHKTECLRTALATKGGTRVVEEQVDRAYQSGMIGFLERWSKKKKCHLKQTTVQKTVNNKEG
jgi:hypothetical protein